MPQTTYVTREYELKPRQKELLLAAVSRRAPTALRLNHGTLTAVAEDSPDGIGLPLTSHQVKRIERNTRKKMGVELRLSKAQLHAMRKGGVGKLVGVQGGGIKDTVVRAAKKAAPYAKTAGKAALAAAGTIAASEAGKKVASRVAEEALKHLVSQAKEHVAQRKGAGLKKKKQA